MHVECFLSFSQLWDVQLWAVSFDKGSFGLLSGNKDGLENMSWEDGDFSTPLSVKILLQTLAESI